MPTAAEALSSLIGTGGSLAAAYLPYEATGDQMQALKDMVAGFQTQSGELGTQLQGISQFQPFTVTTPTSTSDVTAGGGYGVTLGQVPQAIQTGLLGGAQTAAGALGGTAPDLSALQQAAFGGANTALGGLTADDALASQRLTAQGLLSGQLGMFGLPQETLGDLTSAALTGAETGLATAAPSVSGAYSGISAPSVSTAAGDVASQYLTAGSNALGQATPTATSLFQDIRAMQTPEEERQRIALENRLAAQGRLGVSTAAYGGTPEQLALEKAQAEARNSAAFQATQMADQLATAAQNRAQQLSTMGLNAEQIQARLNSEGFTQAMQLAGAGISAEQAQSGLQTEQQARAAQLAQLGLTGTQAQQQLTTQQLANITGLSAADIATAQAQQGLQQGAATLGTGLFGLGQAASVLPQTMTSTDIANLQGMLGAAYTPQTQAIAAMNPAVQLANISQAARQGELEALYKTGIAGLQAGAEGTSSIATLEASRARALADALQGLFAGGSSVAGETATSPIDTLIDYILGDSAQEQSGPF
jgi:hypothetical protein